MGDGDAHGSLERRSFLALGGKLALLALLPAPALALPVGPTATPAHPGLANSSLNLLNIHTGERLSCVYREAGRLVPGALAAVDQILRDHRTGEVRPIDPALLDVMDAVARRVDASGPLHVVSGYRSAATNAALRRRGRGVARHSFHILGKAVDLQVPGVATSRLRAAALGLRAGGVGYYPDSGFVHVDTGPVRRW